MSNDNGMRIFFEIHRGNPQEGPGDTASTERAFALVTGLPVDSAVLDVGCGPGRQTLDLCRLMPGTITAVDNHPPFLSDTSSKLTKAGQTGRARVLQADMAALPFEPGSFHLIWSEGAIYNIGFRHGLELWKPLLQPGGCVAVTELTLLREDLPGELEAFWKEAYPAIQTAEENLADLREAGYREIGHFTLPESAWWNYYRPIEEKLNQMEAQYRDNAEALEILGMERKEIDLYRRYSGYYGYVFYVGRNEVNHADY